MESVLLAGLAVFAVIVFYAGKPGFTRARGLGFPAATILVVGAILFHLAGEWILAAAAAAFWIWWLWRMWRDPNSN